MLITLPLSSADRLEIWRPQAPAVLTVRPVSDTKCVFLFFLTNLSQTFLILRITERDMIKNV